MTKKFSIVCKETERRICIGQGWSEMTSFYKNSRTLCALESFLNNHNGKDILFICEDDNDWICDYREYNSHEQEIQEKEEKADQSGDSET